MTKKAIIVFSGFNQRAVVAFLRTLEQKQVAYTLIASSPEDSIFQTKYRQRVSCTRKVKALNLDDLLESIGKAKKTLVTDEYLIAPSTEALNRFLIKHRNVFKKRDCEIPLVDKVIGYYNDTHKLYELSKKGQRKTQMLFDTNTQINARIKFFKKFIDLEMNDE